MASARPFGPALTVTVAGAFVALLGAPAVAQQPPQQQKTAPAAPAQKAPAQKQAPAQPAQPQAQPGQGGQPGQQQAGGDQPQLMYSPWMKVCGKGPDTNNKQVCVVTKDGRLENGMPVAIVQLFEPEGGQKVLAG